MTKITFPLKPQAHGPAVAALQDALIFLIDKAQLQAPAADLAAFRAGVARERTQSAYGDTTRKVVGVFEEMHRLPVTGEVDEATAKALNDLLDELGAFNEQPVTGDDDTYQVTGHVISRTSAAVGGLLVQVLDKAVGGDIVLIEAATAQDGTYQGTFTDDALRARKKTQPDLQARVLSAEKPLAVSEVRYNASRRETLDVLLPDTTTASLPAEHDTLLAALAPHVPGALRTLQETDDRQDISYLANKTGWDARAVALAALADQFSARPDSADVPAPFYYALFRAGLPADEAALYQTDPQTVTDVLTRAAKQGIISPALSGQIPKVASRFRDIGAQAFLSAPPATGVSSVKDILAVSRLTDQQQQQFVAIYADTRTDPDARWQKVSDALGAATATRLQVNGKLAFLTINNAPLIQRLHTAVGGQGVADPIDLVRLGLHRPDQWVAQLTPDMPIPAEIPGDSPAAKRTNYAGYLAAQVRLSYPTAVVAQMIRGAELPLTGTSPAVTTQVQDFLSEHQAKFPIAAQPIRQYIARNKLNVDAEVVNQIARVQRVRQITPDDSAMSALMKRGIDSAHQVALYDKQTFVTQFTGDLGGADNAALIYDKARHVHTAVLNLTVGFLTQRNGLNIGNRPLQGEPPPVGNNEAPGQIIAPKPVGPPPANAADVIAYPTLEGLFGEMDFCTCDECRSILSPAAYLVDLLQFVDQPPPAGKENPQAVLLSRRPDLQHLLLTCENTNTALPYIDIVNETLEYFVANNVQKLSLNGYIGHDTDGAQSADLLASPQFVIDAAYTLLRNERFPEPLPLHQPLETLRRYFQAHEVPLALAMERCRINDALERGANPYGWRDILMEELSLSRAEHDILTASAVVPLAVLFGFPPATSDAAVIDALSNAKAFTRRVGLTYEELVDILQSSRFVNPSAPLVPKLEKLRVPFATLKALKDGTITGAAFDALLPTGTDAPDPALYSGDIKAWVTDNANFARIMALITLTNPSGADDPCNFGGLEFRHAQPMTGPGDKSNRLSVVEFVRLMRFIRLWHKTSWTIEQTDAAICALYRADLKPVTDGDLTTLVALDTGFLTLLPRLGVLSRVMRRLNLTVVKDLTSLLACWSTMGTDGDTALYRQIFLTPAILQQDPVFADNGVGQFLVDATQKLSAHVEAVRSALGLAADDYDRIAAPLGFDGNTPLTLANVTAIFRRGYLARKLRISVRELLLLTSLTGLDPFAAPDDTNPAIVQLIDLVQALRDRGMKTSVALYLIWNQDLSGRSAPTATQLTELVRQLRNDYSAVEDQFAATEDPTGDVARARMALVYGSDPTTTFFGLLDNTMVLDVAYTHPNPTLEPAITGTDARLAYDDFAHRLSYTGVLTATARAALLGIVGTPAVFKTAIEALFARSEDVKGSFFARYPELEPLYTTYVASIDPPEVKGAALLAAFKPELARRRKRQQALQRLSATAGVDLVSTQTLLDPTAAPYPLHAATGAGAPALNDVLALETPGLLARFFFRNTATGTIDQSVPATAPIDYGQAGDRQLPANPVPGQPISATFTGQVEAPQAGFFNLVIEADPTATVTLTFGGAARALTQNGSVRRNSAPFELAAGTLYDIELKVEAVTSMLALKWETPTRPREVIPSRYLYPPSIMAPFTAAYVRFLKAASLLVGLTLIADELAHFAIDADYAIAGDGWMNQLPVVGSAAAPVAAALLTPLRDLLDYARIKAAISPDATTLLDSLTDPVKATAPDGALLAVTRWDKTSLDGLLAHVGGTIAGLAHFPLFRRVYDALAVLELMGISAQALLAATTNEPTGPIVRDAQAALRARYAASDWRDLVQPINDSLRSLQRDALVAYILHQMGANPATAHIDTPDKLFEYFLMDVQMEPCMQTSRIRHALSSAQLFIERCLMNLEPRVSPSSINPSQWDWMKRYRVWEANRKVFLYPENWAEPELRDDQSIFFKETMGELLQGDITDDRAAEAMLNYLSKLEEVAKLEVCGIHFVENGEGRDDDVLHVIARTSGAQRKYFYRRREYSFWTPWEPIKLDIEDTPVIPVVWNDRLFVFWLRLVKQTPVDANKASTSSVITGKVADADLSSIKGDARTSAQTQTKVTVQAVLNWSEYFNGKWQNPRTSDVNQPLWLGEFDAAGSQAFDRSKLKLSAFFWTRGTLRIIVSNDIGAGASFFLYNTHSAPELRNEKKNRHFSPRRTLDTAGNTLTIAYPPDAGQPVVGDEIADRTVEPNHPISGHPWDAPFFYDDSRHAFYVTTTQQLVPVWYWIDFAVTPKPPKVTLDLPPLVVQIPPRVPDPIGPIARQPGFGVVNPSPVQFAVSEDAYIRRGLGTLGTVRFGGKEIGPTGSLIKSYQKG
jgi:hypothetical protein